MMRGELVLGSLETLLVTQRWLCLKRRLNPSLGRKRRKPGIKEGSCSAGWNQRRGPDFSVGKLLLTLERGSSYPHDG
jgi:hypothetical protein